MRDFHQFCEGKGDKKSSSSESSKTKSIVDLASAIRKEFGKMTRARRYDAWEALTSPKGRKEMLIFANNPSRSLSRIKRLASGFRECVESPSQEG